MEPTEYYSPLNMRDKEDANMPMVERCAIGSNIEQLNVTLRSLEKTVEAMRARLSPIMRKEQGGEKPATSAIGNEGSSELSNALKDIGRRIEAYVAQLEDIMANLEV